MTQPYPGPYQGPGPYQQRPYPPMPYPAPIMPRYRPLRKVAIVSIVLMGLTSLAAVIQSVLLWRSYDEVKRLVYGLLSEEEIDRGVESISGTGPLLNLVSYLLMGTGIAFLIWLWQARENTDFLYSPFAPRPAFPADPVRGPHRRANGWVVGAWFCPIVQFWYPFQIVQDISKASEPPEAPRSGRVRTLLYSWWATWTAFWVILVGGGTIAVIGFIVWFIRLVQVSESSDASSPYVDIYDMQDFMVRVALGVDIGFTVATVLLIVAAVAASFLMLQVTDWQHTRATPPPIQDAPRPVGPPQYAPRYHRPGPNFPTYGP